MFSDAGSVMNLSESESRSEYTYTDEDEDDSDDQTAYTYADDDDEAMNNLNCMNSLFFPAAKEQDDIGMIHCQRVGPSSAELQLNIPLPSQYMNHIQGTTKENTGGMMNSLDGVCRAPSFNMNYNPAHYDPALAEEHVVEIDPYKQFRERAAPQFYESLIEELSGDEDEEGSDEDDNDEDDEALRNKKDDSQIFGFLDAQRRAEEQWQMALYNEIVLQQGPIHSPPSQIFVTDSFSTALTPQTDEEAKREPVVSIELSIDGSSEVFCQPEDSQDLHLTSHLRESVEVGTVVSKVTPPAPIQHQTISSVPTMDQPFDVAAASPKPPLGPRAIRTFLEEPAPSMDETDIQRKNQKKEKYADTKNAVTGVPRDETMSSKTAETKSGDDTPSPGAFAHSGDSLQVFPSFDECGQGKSRSATMNTPQERTTESGKKNSDEESDKKAKATCVTKEYKRAMMTSNLSIDVQVNEIDVPADERKGSFLLAGSKDEADEPSRITPKSSATSRKGSIPPPPPPPPRQRRSSSTSSTQKVRFAAKDNVAKPSPTVAVKETVTSTSRGVTPNSSSKSRIILEESSKPNIRSKARSAKSARELRKERIRSFDPVRPALAAAALFAMVEKASRDNSTRSNGSGSNRTAGTSSSSTLSSLGENTPLENIDEVPDLEDLEFHSCDEGFSSHSRSALLME